MDNHSCLWTRVAVGSHELINEDTWVLMSEYEYPWVMSNSINPSVFRDKYIL